MSFKVSRRRALVTVATVAAGALGGNVAPRRGARAGDGEHRRSAGDAPRRDPTGVPVLHRRQPGAHARRLPWPRRRAQPLGRRGAGLASRSCRRSTPSPRRSRRMTSSCCRSPRTPVGRRACAPFSTAHDIDHLPVLLDPGGAITQAWQVPGHPDDGDLRPLGPSPRAACRWRGLGHGCCGGADQGSVRTEPVEGTGREDLTAGPLRVDHLPGHARRR